MCSISNIMPYKTRKLKKISKKAKPLKLKGGNLEIKYPPKEINNYVAHIIYINLDKRTDRNESIQKQLAIFDQNKITRMSAVNNPENPIVGCATSHLNAIKMARTNNYPNVLILEDDAVWSDIDKGYPKFEMLAKKPYDVIMLGGTFKKYDKNTYKVNSAQSTASYLVNSSYYDKIIDGIQKSLADPNTDKNVDVMYTIMQKQDNWFIVIPALMIQFASISNIQKAHVNYKGYFSNKGVNLSGAPIQNNHAGGNNENRCIFSSLTGGLGNYLFIYSAALLVKNKILKDHNLDLPICFIKDENPHSKVDYISELFKQGKIYTNSDLTDRLNKSQKPFNHIENAHNNYRNTNIKYNNIGDVSLKHTYYQNYEGMKSTIPIITKEVIPILEKKYPNLKTEFNDTRNISAFMHVRRGDYNEENYLPLIYYQNALSILESHNIKNLYILSNDIKWCREQKWNTNLNIQYVDNNDELYCLYLMSLCLAGAIISHSSFSLWGVFLGAYHNKSALILYPSKWYLTNSSDNLKLPSWWKRVNIS